MSLAQVLAAVQVRRFDQAIAWAAQVWATTRHPVIADVLDALTELDLAARDFRVRGTRNEFHAAWLQRAAKADFAMVGWLAKTLTERLPVNVNKRASRRENYHLVKYAAWFQRLTALQNLKADPRIASALAAVLEEPPLNMGTVHRSIDLYRPVIALLQKCGDVRGIARLSPHEQLPGAKNQLSRGLQATLIPYVLTPLSKIQVAPLLDETEWKRLVKPVPRVKTALSEEQLLEQVYANVADDAPRAAYADMLTERADDRGEFIALQLALANELKIAKAARPEARSVAELLSWDSTWHYERRSQAMLRAYRMQWLGPLGATLKIRFERGFPCEATVLPNAAAPARVWELAFRDPRLATVEILNPGKGSEAHFEALLNSPAARNVHTTSLRSHSLVPLFGRQPLAERLQTMSIAAEVLIHSQPLRHFAWPRLHSLEVDTAYRNTSAVTEAVLSYRWAGQLKVLTIDRFETSEPFAREVDALWKALSLDLLILGDRWHRISRHPDGLHYGFHGYSAEESLKFLQQTSLKLRRVSMHPYSLEKVDRKELAAAAKANGAELVMLK